MKKIYITFTASLFLAFSVSPIYSENLNPSDLKSSVCESCHGQDGNSTHSLLPNLAGQNPAYFILQVKNFLKGNRKHPLLKPSTEENTTEAQIKKLATYYSNLEEKNTKDEQLPIPLGLLSSPIISTQTIKQGESIYSSCSGCHGVKAEGITPYPKLSGQKTEYLKQQLTNFKTGTRNNSLMQMMTVNLSDGDINALAIYLSTLNK